MNAVDRYRQQMAGAAEAAEEMRRAERRRADELTALLPALERAAHAAQAVADGVHQDLDALWEEAADDLCWVMWTSLGVYPEPDVTVDPAQLDELRAAATASGLRLRRAVVLPGWLQWWPWPR